MWDFVSLKCNNWLVKCNLFASDAVLALERRFTRPSSRVRTHVHVIARPKSRPQNESGLKLPCTMLASVGLAAA